ncbi:hypothetical protein [Clostridium sp. HBUAS56010]|uniref:hypothetical protein n=1 Tax=Clostridium sp. HBUAS56010 TaxID=2571127 RepID=UPI0011773356|nr:hypothetical protein [Clostridium sp. HBUAS56010]
MDIFDKYFYLLEDGDVIAEIEVDEELEEYCIYFYNVDADVDNFIIPKERVDELLNVIPNSFLLEHCG